MKRLALRGFGEQVRRARERLGLSQDELAVRCSTHRNYIGGIERGERNPTLLKVLAIAEALEISPNALLSADAGALRGRTR